MSVKLSDKSKLTADELYDKYKDTIRKVAMSAKMKWCRNIPLDDLIQEGAIHLMHVSGLTNPGKGFIEGHDSNASFETYLWKCLNNKYRDLSKSRQWKTRNFVGSGGDEDGENVPIEEIVVSPEGASPESEEFYFMLWKSLLPLPQAILSIKRLFSPQRVSFKQISEALGVEHRKVLAANQQIKKIAAAIHYSQGNIQSLCFGTFTWESAECDSCADRFLCMKESDMTEPVSMAPLPPVQRAPVPPPVPAVAPPPPRPAASVTPPTPPRPAASVTPPTPPVAPAPSVPEPPPVKEVVAPPPQPVPEPEPVIAPVEPLTVELLVWYDPQANPTTYSYFAEDGSVYAKPTENAQLAKVTVPKNQIPSGILAAMEQYVASQSQPQQSPAPSTAPEPELEVEEEDTSVEQEEDESELPIEEKATRRKRRRDAGKLRGPRRGPKQRTYADCMFERLLLSPASYLELLIAINVEEPNYFGNRPTQFIKELTRRGAVEELQPIEEMIENGLGQKVPVSTRRWRLREGIVEELIRTEELYTREVDELPYVEVGGKKLRFRIQLSAMNPTGI